MIQRPASVRRAASRTRATISSTDLEPRSGTEASDDAQSPMWTCASQSTGGMSGEDKDAPATMVIEAHHPKRPSVMRRLSAWMIDFFLVSVFLGLVFFLKFVFTVGKLEIGGVSTPGSRQILGALTLTLPVLLYFAISEASVRQGSVGKLAMRLKVTDCENRRIGLGRSLLR